MDTPRVLWIDLRLFPDEVSPYSYLDKNWPVSRIANSENLILKIRKTSPTLLFFEYDFPDISGLSAVRRTRRLFPSLPVIMITEQHSEALAIWALRMHIWDYFVKPVQARELLASATAILKQKIAGRNDPTEQPQLFNPLPPDVRFRSDRKRKTYPAQTFVENHYHEKIYEKQVARLCGMNVSTFSRYFKKEHSMTFRDYLISYRIRKAKELLLRPNTSVTDIAYTVGFHDPSHFTRTFRRNVGMNPSHYREIYKLY
jgi:YesN/AraC family two-component response regulator